ncbi:hypothetical protein [Methylosinus sp. RM1]|uniref:hypothetical protein n=1 Tax=Methylosinus sp. RM1 TaxID=2583817 RepID=UPI001408A867|nr:hypothetical protein [Methylosinus sp. RM1]
MERCVFWNSCELMHPFPIVAYREGENTAHVRYGGHEATLPAQFQRERDLRYNGSSPQMIDLGKSRVSIDGFAARFPKGRRVWNARLDFIRADDETEWSFREVYLFKGPVSGAPPQIIGFLKDRPAKDRAISGTDKTILLRYRARAGLPDGPVNAADFETSKAWAFAESLWADETKKPFETAKIVGLSVSFLLRKLGTPTCFAGGDERASA